MVYATSLAAELRKRRMQLELRTGGDTRPRSRIDRSQNVTGSGSAEQPVIIIDDLSSPEDEVNPNDVRSMKDSSSPKKQMSLEPDAKKRKMELSDVEAVEQQTLPQAVVNDALLSAIPMPSLPPSAPAVTVEQKCSPAVAEEKLQKCSPVVAEEKLSPVPASPHKQHYAAVHEQKTSPASIDQNVTGSDAWYAFRRLTELPMPPAAPDDDYESPSENSR